jgi:hypothetical protein
MTRNEAQRRPAQAGFAKTSILMDMQKINFLAQLMI